MLNKWVGMGRLTKDPDLRSTQNGVAVCNFTIAVERDRKNQDGSRQADFINCIAWRQTAEFISKYFAKGRMIAVVGSIQTRAYQDRDGNQRQATEVVVTEATFTGEAKPEEKSPDEQGYIKHDSPYQSGKVQDIDYDEPDSDLPF